MCNGSDNDERSKRDAVARDIGGLEALVRAYQVRAVTTPKLPEPR